MQQMGTYQYDFVTTSLFWHYNGDIYLNSPKRSYVPIIHFQISQTHLIISCILTYELKFIHIFDP